MSPVMVAGGIHKGEYRAVYCPPVWRVFPRCQPVREDLLSALAGLFCNRVQFLLPVSFYLSESSLNILIRA